MSANQDRVASWVRKVFTEKEATDAPERSLRTAEEAIELAQACGVDAATVHRLVDYVFSRPVGKPEQEIAGTMVTVYAMAAAIGVDAQEVFEMELSRIQQPEIIDRCRRRQHEKRAALVPLPGPLLPERSASGLEGPKRTSAPPVEKPLLKCFGFFGCGWSGSESELTITRSCPVCHGTHISVER